MQNIDLSAIERKSFTINGDENRVLYLNTSDMSLPYRYEEVSSKLYNSLNNIESDIENLSDSEKIAYLMKLDAEMRDAIDYIFDSNVSEVCATQGNMYDPINGRFRFEYIIDSLTALYENEIQTETQKMYDRIKTHTKKYEKVQ